MEKQYICDNCGKVIKYLRGHAFQTGETNQGKIGTWCSKKCSNEYTKCKFDVGFNQLGMPFFACLTHGSPNSKYHKAKRGCYEKLARELNNLIN